MSQEISSPFSLYREHGIVCVPTGYTITAEGSRLWHKYPRVNWTPYEKRLPTIEECELWDTWFAKGECGIAVVCGEKSGIIAVDFDTGNLLAVFPEGTCKKVGQRFETRFYKYNGESYRRYKLPDSPGKNNDAEILTEGRIVMIPPSNHPDTGKQYYWVDKDLLTAELTDLPPEVLKSLDERCGQKETPKISGAGCAYPIEFIDDVLSYIPCESASREEWLRVGMGLDDCYGDAGFPHWNTWSATDKSIGKNGAPRYDPQGIRKIWASFDSNKNEKVTILTVISMAIKNGFSEPPVVYEVSEPAQVSVPVIRFPITPLSEELIDAAPDILGELTKDIVRTAPIPNKHMAFAAAMGALALAKAYRIKSPSGLRPVMCVIAVGGSGTGKQHPKDYIAEMFGQIANDAPLDANEFSREGRERCDSWLTGYPASGPGVTSAILSGVKLFLIDEIGKHFSDGKRPDQEFQRIMTAITEYFTGANGLVLGKSYANSDGKRPQKNIRNPHLNLVGFSSYKDIWPAIDQIKFGTGTWERFSLVFGRVGRSLGARHSLPPHDSSICDKLATFMHKFTNNGAAYTLKTVQISKAGEELLLQRALKYVNFKLPGVEEEVCDGFISRLEAKAIQLAMIAWDGDNGEYTEPMPLSILGWAYDVVEGMLLPFLKEAIPMYCSQSEDRELRDAVKAYVWDEKWGTVGVSKTMISRHFQSVDGGDLGKALARLVEQGFVLEDKVTQAGSKRPTTFYKKGLN